jgi:FkbM family methyltransferase
MHDTERHPVASSARELCYSLSLCFKKFGIEIEPFSAHVIGSGDYVGDESDSRKRQSAVVEFFPLRVYRYEVNKDSHESEKNRGQSFEVFVNQAIGDGHEHDLYVTNFPACSSFLKPNTEFLAQIDSGTFLPLLQLNQIEKGYKTITLDDFFKENKVESPVSIRMDVQGFELCILQNAINAIRNSSLIQVEVGFQQLYEKQPYFADIDAFLRANNFNLIMLCPIHTRPLTPFKSSVLTNPLFLPLWTDALYFNSLFRMELMSTQKLLSSLILSVVDNGLVDLGLRIAFEVEKRGFPGFSENYITIMSGVYSEVFGRK